VGDASLMLPIQIAPQGDWLVAFNRCNTVL